MGSYSFVLLLVVLTASFSNGFNMTLLDELQALRFEEIGELKLIKSYKAIKFHINIEELTESMENATEHFLLVKDMFPDDTYTQNKLSNINMVLNLKEMEFKDMLHGLVKTERDIQSNKKKRGIFGILTSDDGKSIALDLKNINNKANELVDISNVLRSISHNTLSLLNKTIEEIAKKSALMYLLEEKDDIERVMNGLTKMLTERRLNSVIVPIDKFDKAIKNITSTIDEALPYDRLMDYYYNLRLNYKFNKDVIEVEIDIPMVERAPRKLLKIVEIPARYEEKLIMTDVLWKYIAVNDNETVVFMTMDVCFKSQQNGTEYFCKTQSPIKNKNAIDCLNNAVSGKKTIDMALCKHSTAQPTGLMFIKLNEGEYFYYTPVNETLTVTCGAETTDKLLIEKTSGIIELDPECIAFTSTYKLIATMRYEATSFTKINVVRVFFDVNQLKENLRKYNTPFVDKFYIDSVALLRDISNPVKSIERLDEINRGGMNLDFMSYLTITASAIIVLYVLYNIWRCWKDKREKEQENTKQKPLEEPIEYIVVKG